MGTFPHHSSTFCTSLQMQHLLFPPHNKRFILFWPEWQSAKSLLTMKQPRWQPVLSSGWHAAKGISVLTEVSKGKGKKKKKMYCLVGSLHSSLFFFPWKTGAGTQAAITQLSALQTGNGPAVSQPVREITHMQKKTVFCK